MALAGSRVAIQHPSAWSGRVGVVVQVSHDVGNASIRREHVDDEDDRAPATVIVAQEHLIRLTHAPASTPARRSEGVADAAMETHSTRTGIVTTHFRPVTASASKRRRLVALEGDNDVELDNAVNTELASFYHKQRQQIGGTKSSSSSSSDEEHVPVISTEMTRASAGVGLASALGLSPSASGIGDPFTLVQMAGSVSAAGDGEGMDDDMASLASDRATGTDSVGSSHASGSHVPSRTSVAIRIRRSAHLDSSPESRED